MVEHPLTAAGPFTLRRPTEADHAQVARLAGRWWSERPPPMPRLLFRHFARTSCLAASADGHTVGIALSFQGQDDPGHGGIVVVAVAPSARRRGLGRALVRAVEERLRDVGARRIEAVIWPGNRAGVRFLEALGYAPIPESLGTPLYGVPALADYDGDGEDRAVFVRELAAP